MSLRNTNGLFMVTDSGPEPFSSLDDNIINGQHSSIKG